MYEISLQGEVLIMFLDRTLPDLEEVLAEPQLLLTWSMITDQN